MYEGNHKLESGGAEKPLQKLKLGQQLIFRTLGTPKAGSFDSSSDAEEELMKEMSDSTNKRGQIARYRLVWRG